MDEKKIGVFVILLIGVVVSIALLSPIADRTQEMTNKLQVTNESISLHVANSWNTSGTINTTNSHTVTNVPAAGWIRNSCPLTSIVYGNESNNYTVTTDYTFNTTHGTLLLLNTSTVAFGGNDTAIDYQYCTAGYITDGAARNVTRLILIAAGLAILGFAIYYGVKEWL